MEGWALRQSLGLIQLGLSGTIPSGRTSLSPNPLLHIEEEEKACGELP